MSDNPSAQVVWTGLVPSTSARRSKRTGRLLEYRVVLFSDSTATCTCPAMIFRETRGPDVSSQPLPCKHVEIARRAQQIAPPVPAPTLTPGKITVTPALAETIADDFLSEFEDDAFADLPQIRHTPRDE